MLAVKSGQEHIHNDQQIHFTFFDSLGYIVIVVFKRATVFGRIIRVEFPVVFLDKVFQVIPAVLGGIIFLWLCRGQLFFIPKAHCLLIFFIRLVGKDGSQSK